MAEATRDMAKNHRDKWKKQAEDMEKLAKE